MKFQKTMVSVLSALFLLLSLFGCTSKDAQTSANTPSSNKDQVEIYIYQNKVEIDEGLKAACNAYTASHPNVTFKIESNSNDYATSLKAMFAGGNAPDIFSTQGNDDLALMKDYTADLSDQPWVANMSEPSRASGTIDGKVLGWPLIVEGYGYLYHKDLFEAAGITELPKTRDELILVCEQLKAHGIEPMLTNYAEWYQTGVYYMNMAIARQDDPMTFMDGLTAGTVNLVGNKEFEDLTAWISVEMENSLSPLNMDFNTQMAKFCMKEAAITLGGNFSQPTLDEVDPDMDIGMFPIPLGNDAEANDRYYVGANTFWSVYDQSSNKEAAKDFLIWLCMDPEGQSHLVSSLKVLPGFTNVEADKDAIGPTGLAILEYITSGKTYGYLHNYFPTGMGACMVFGETIDKYAAGNLSAEQMLEQLQVDWQNAGK